MLLFAALFAFVSLPTDPGIADVTQRTGTALQYRLVEFDLTVTAPAQNPFDQKEIAVDLVFTAPSGKILRLPCFFASPGPEQRSFWKARFTPVETGTYRIKAELSLKGIPAPARDAGTMRVRPSGDRGFLSASGPWIFRYSDGTPFRGIGENFSWESRDEDDSRFFRALHEDKRFSYDRMLPKLAKNGATFFRTWMIYWNLPVDWPTPQNNSRYTASKAPFNESGLKRMDRLTQLCDSLGLHMMLALESHVGFMGTGWDISPYNRKNGGAATTPLEFFTLPEARAQYKNKLRLMVARYGYSPSIGAWEFFNEIDNVMYHFEPRIPDSIITGWHRDMSTYLAGIDPFDHIITTSVSHRDVEGLNDLPEIDLNQRHIYRHTGDIPALLQTYQTRHNRPYAIGEFGFEWDWSRNFDDMSEGMIGDFKHGLWLGLFNPTPVLPMSWWWEWFDEKGLTPYFNRVRTVNDRMLKAGNGNFTSIRVHAEDSAGPAWAVKAGRTRFVYAWAGTGSGGSRRLRLEDASQPGTVTAFDPETGRTQKIRVNRLPGGVIALPAGSSGGAMIYWWD